MALTDEVISKALQCAGETNVQSFTAAPNSIQPFSGGSTLTWEVKPPSGCEVELNLNGSSIYATGTCVVQPTETTTYHLEAITYGIRKVLDTLTVTVDTHLCFTGSITEDEVRQAIQNELDRGLSGSRVSKRGPASVEVDTSGISVRLRLRISIDNFADPDLNINFRMVPRVQDGQASFLYRSFDVDVDWPWWVGMVTQGASKIVEEVIEAKVEFDLKPRLLQEVQNLLDSYLSEARSTYRLYSLTTVSNQINLTMCPTS